jgi:hypothetical protein
MALSWCPSHHTITPSACRWAFLVASGRYPHHAEGPPPPGANRAFSSGHPGGDAARARKALNAATIAEMHRAFREGGRAAILKVMRQQAGAAAPAGSTCEGLWSIFATDVGSFEETARALSGSGGIFLVYGASPPCWWRDTRALAHPPGGVSGMSPKLSVFTNC